jgi:hypothetical protein
MMSADNTLHGPISTASTIACCTAHCACTPQSVQGYVSSTASDNTTIGAKKHTLLEPHKHK